LAFRALVISHPRWYPTLSAKVRGALINFTRRMMAGPRFDHTDVDALFGAVP
jgi:hypothetical protein